MYSHRMFRRRIGRAALAGAFAIGLLLPQAAANAQTARDTGDACPPEKVPTAGFSDTAGTTFEDDIDCVVWWEVATGTGSGYSPGAGTNRAQMATFIANMLDAVGAELPDEPETRFSDVGTSVHADSIHRLADVDIVQGTGGGRYSPTRTVSREQMVTFIIRAYEFATGEDLDDSPAGFSDTSGSVHETNIDKAANAGIAAGSGDGRFRPGADVTRGQLAGFVSRALALFVDGGFARPPQVTILLCDTTPAQGSVNCGSTSIDGTTYPATVLSTFGYFGGNTRSIEYDLSRDFATFEAVAGITDGSNSSHRFELRVFADSERIHTSTFAFGEHEELELDVTGALRLRIELERLASGGCCDGATFGFGEARISD